MVGNAAAMGWTPVQLMACTVSEYRAALAGWNRSQGAPEPIKREHVARARAAMERARKREERRSRA